MFISDYRFNNLTMKQFVTLLLMLTTLLTFAQKATAFAPMLESEMSDCSMQMLSEKVQTFTDCKTEMAQKMGCNYDCEFMSVLSVLYFVEHNKPINQLFSQVIYPSSHSSFPFYFPESLYRPPFLN